MQPKVNKSFEARCLDMLRGSSDPKKAAALANQVILESLVQPQSCSGQVLAALPGLASIAG